MRRVVGVVLTSVVAFGAVPALAKVSCDQFKAALESADAKSGDLLPDIEYEASAYTPGLENITNLLNIKASIQCGADGAFQGLGASLTQGAMTDAARWTAFVQSAVAAVDARNAGKALPFASKLQDAAIMKAKKEQIRTGRMVGAADGRFGGYAVDYRVLPGALRLSIDP
ncbi:hypothetical protein [Microvirga solisilvae]|uniref:hypothetical protein n=1 Tax=Microvirga solisilvae TaxID=2919498 RepID=UPI001FAF27CB|nr:hypothetical protein [Microvirga solisilvae]